MGHEEKYIKLKKKTFILKPYQVISLKVENFQEEKVEKENLSLRTFFFFLLLN